ncbi:MAG: hypothetical protein DVS81_17760 [Candidatus Accumulibacter meliphilus]|uniref:Uncharacterized protein n=1 Tax=Candidatus Accumulibacter meliphilus TaxID=2211374 RepID=A0A369XGL1_9PROT|nr:MAG: hypothetical protein DVS81_17760 [Candidatus Accumulibacter meliphilus]
MNANRLAGKIIESQAIRLPGGVLAGVVLPEVVEWDAAEAGDVIVRGRCAGTSAEPGRALLASPKSLPCVKSDPA